MVLEGHWVVLHGPSVVLEGHSGVEGHSIVLQGPPVVLEGRNCVLGVIRWFFGDLQWFWRAVTMFDDERRARLLQFVTGSFRVPIDGFKALRGQSLKHSSGAYIHLK